MWTEIASGALGAGLGALLVFISSQRSLRAANILAERTRWREEIRRLALELFDGRPSERRRAAFELALRLNPYHNEDREILRQALFATPDLDPELLTRISLLLKHDWERAKIEASWLPLCVDRRASRRTYEHSLRLFK